jgi:hypothetical protein
MTGTAKFLDCTFIGSDLTGGQFKQGLFEGCSQETPAQSRGRHFVGLLVPAATGVNTKQRVVRESQ